MKLHKGKVVFLQNNFKKFENCVMPNIVALGEKVYTIPEQWRVED